MPVIIQSVNETLHKSIELTVGDNRNGSGNRSVFHRLSRRKMPFQILSLDE